MRGKAWIFIYLDYMEALPESILTTFGIDLFDVD
jgi:hypothetical protein